MNMKEIGSIILVFQTIGAIVHLVMAQAGDENKRTQRYAASAALYGSAILSAVLMK